LLRRGGLHSGDLREGLQMGSGGVTQVSRTASDEE
jgi:hypothetical protein